MPLDPSGLETDFAAFFAAPPNGAGNVAASRAACAIQWASALTSYAAAVVPPSTAVAAAGTALQAAFVSAMGGVSLGAFDAAITAWAAAIGAGMAPGFVATPPPSSSVFVTEGAVLRVSSATAASDWAASIDAWMRTGTATPSGGGAAVAWS